MDVGERQAGRPAAATVIHAEPDAVAIAAAIGQALAAPRGDGETPYGDGCSAMRIVEVLNGLPDRAALLAKQFVEVGA
ncbi:hypothetical protein D3C84_1224060 [compost metagenome]